MFVSSIYFLSFKQCLGKLKTSFLSLDTDRDFDPTADMLVHDFDDEHTMEEEEALSNSESVGSELDNLEKVSAAINFIIILMV